MQTVGGMLRAFGAVREVIEELGRLHPDRLVELMRMHRPAIALLEPGLPMTAGMRARNERMQRLNHLPNVRLDLRPLHEAYKGVLDDFADTPISLAVHEAGWDRESAELLSDRDHLTFVGPTPILASGLQEDVEKAASEAFACHAFSVSGPHAEVWASAGDVDAHYVAGLSAHHLDPFDPQRSARAAAHLTLVAEESPHAHQRAHAHYRLAVHRVRHDDDPEAGRERAEAAIETADEIEELADCYRAWALNARAFALYRLGQRNEAASDLQRALGLLGALHLEPPLDRYLEDSVGTMEMNLARVRS